jgi:hypothetical protein
MSSHREGFVLSPLRLAMLAIVPVAAVVAGCGSGTLMPVPKAIATILPAVTVTMAPTTLPMSTANAALTAPTTLPLPAAAGITASVALPQIAGVSSTTPVTVTVSTRPPAQIDSDLIGLAQTYYYVTIGLPDSAVMLGNPVIISPNGGATSEVVFSSSTPSPLGASGAARAASSARGTLSSNPVTLGTLLDISYGGSSPMPTSTPPPAPAVPKGCTQSYNSTTSTYSTYCGAVAIALSSVAVTNGFPTPMPSPVASAILTFDPDAELFGSATNTPGLIALPPSGFTYQASLSYASTSYKTVDSNGNVTTGSTYLPQAQAYADTQCFAGLLSNDQVGAPGQTDGSITQYSQNSGSETFSWSSLAYSSKLPPTTLTPAIFNAFSSSVLANMPQPFTASYAPFAALPDEACEFQLIFKYNNDQLLAYSTDLIPLSVTTPAPLVVSPQSATQTQAGAGVTYTISDPGYNGEMGATATNGCYVAPGLQPVSPGTFAFPATVGTSHSLSSCTITFSDYYGVSGTATLTNGIVGNLNLTVGATSFSVLMESLEVGVMGVTPGDQITATAAANSGCSVAPASATATSADSNGANAEFEIAETNAPAACTVTFDDTTVNAVGTFSANWIGGLPTSPVPPPVAPGTPAASPSDVPIGVGVQSHARH